MSKMRILETILAGLAAAGLATAASADDLADCLPPDGATSVSASDMPAALSRALKDRMGDFALPGEDFDITDVVVTGRSWRLIFLWRAGDRWVVATEHGGRGYSAPVFVYDVHGADSYAKLVTVQDPYFSSAVCPAVAAMLLDPP